MIQESIQPKGVKRPKASSLAIKSGDSIFISAQLPLDEKGNLISNQLEEQVNRCLYNISKILEANDLNPSYVLTTKVYLVNLDQLDIVENRMANFFREPYPTRTVIGVSALPKGALLQIEAYALDTRAIEVLLCREQECTSCGEAVCEIFQNIH